MSGRKHRKITPLQVFAEKGDDVSKVNVEVAESERWSNLPSELLESIMSLLKLGDNVRASLVCKSWSFAACAVRVFHQPSWLMQLGSFGSVYEFYDPTERKVHFADLPELLNTTICYVKDGWLLVYGNEARSFFFFNPFTQELINLPLPEKNREIQAVAVSAAPTSVDCIVFSVWCVHPNNSVYVRTWRYGETEWDTVSYRSPRCYAFGMTSKIFFSKGKFYCYNSSGWLGVYDPLECILDVLFVPPPKCPELFYLNYWWRFTFVTESEGEVFIAFTRSKEKPVLCKLDQANLSWNLMKTLEGGTLLLSVLTTHSSIHLLGLRRNSIYFPVIRFYGKRCIFYSLDQHRYYPKNQCPDWEEEDPYEGIWIEPPKDFTGFA